MPLTLDALIVLDAIYRNGSFAAAADALHRVPSAISYTIQKLEQDLDVPLFDRRGHRSVLTAAGQALLEEGQQLLSNVDRIENHVKRIATGWETRLSIAADNLIQISPVLSVIDAFYKKCPPTTQIHLSREVLSGTWDALIARRADLIIGASGESPSGGGYISHAIGDMEMVFAVAPFHPLAKISEPIKQKDILNYRAIAVADTSQSLPMRTSGLLTGQQVLTVSDMNSKLEAHCMGLGVGYLPLSYAQAAIDDNLLVKKQVEEQHHAGKLHIAWHSDHRGKALQWFITQLQNKDIIKRLIFSGTDPIK